MIWLIVLAIVFGIIFALITTAKKSNKAPRTPIKAKQVISMNEQPLYLRLREALPDHYVLAQVAFTAFLTARGYATRNTFNRKVADFVILDRNFKAIAVIELDDASHKQHKKSEDAYRDEIIRGAGIHVIRYSVKPSIEEILKYFNLSRK